MEQTESDKPSVSHLELFLTFSRITLSSFGGALFWARRGLVERQHWLSEREFAELLTLGQLLPGPNVLNLTVLVGYRFAGWTGAAASVAGSWVGRSSSSSAWAGLSALRRLAAGAAGARRHVESGRGTAARHRDQAGDGVAATLAAVVFRALAFVGVGVMRWPLLWVIGALAPCAVFPAWREKD